jgi:hypothetical protein
MEGIMDNDKICLRSAQAAATGSFLILAYSKIRDSLTNYMETIRNMNLYQIGMWAIFIVSLSILIGGKYKRYRENQRTLNDWITYHGPNYEQREFRSLEDKINYLIGIQLKASWEATTALLKAAKEEQERVKGTTIEINEQIQRIKSINERIK